MQQDEAEEEFQLIRDRLLGSAELLELADLSREPNGDLVVSPRKSGADGFVVRFKGYVELHSRLGYMHDFYMIGGCPDIETFAERVVQTVIRLLKGSLVYIYDDVGGGGIVEVEELEDWVGRGHKSLFFA
ncbi:hypothetical protein MCEMSE15_01473 [Fimbriimonadaceae bacterium]